MQSKNYLFFILQGNSHKNPEEIEFWIRKRIRDLSTDPCIHPGELFEIKSFAISFHFFEYKFSPHRWFKVSFKIYLNFSKFFQLKKKKLTPFLFPFFFRDCLLENTSHSLFMGTHESLIPRPRTTSSKSQHFGNELRRFLLDRVHKYFLLQTDDSFEPLPRLMRD